VVVCLKSKWSQQLVEEGTQECKRKLAAFSFFIIYFQQKLQKKAICKRKIWHLLRYVSITSLWFFHQMNAAQSVRSWFKTKYFLLCETDCWLKQWLHYSVRDKSAAAFAQVFVNLLDEIKDSLRQSIFMKLFDFKVTCKLIWTCTYFVVKFESSFGWFTVGEWFKIRIFQCLQKKSSSRNDSIWCERGFCVQGDACEKWFLCLLTNLCV